MVKVSFIKNFLICTTAVLTLNNVLLALDGGGQTDDDDDDDIVVNLGWQANSRVNNFIAGNTGFDVSIVSVIFAKSGFFNFEDNPLGDGYAVFFMRKTNEGNHRLILQCIDREGKRKLGAEGIDVLNEYGSDLRIIPDKRAVYTQLQDSRMVVFMSAVDVDGNYKIVCIRLINAGENVIQIDSNWGLDGIITIDSVTVESPYFFISKFNAENNDKKLLICYSGSNAGLRVALFDPANGILIDKTDVDLPSRIIQNVNGEDVYYDGDLTLGQIKVVRPVHFLGDASVNRNKTCVVWYYKGILISYAFKVANINNRIQIQEPWEWLVMVDSNAESPILGNQDTYMLNKGVITREDGVVENFFEIVYIDQDKKGGLRVINEPDGTSWYRGKYSFATEISEFRLIPLSLNTFGILYKKVNDSQTSIVYSRYQLPETGAERTIKLLRNYSIIDSNYHAIGDIAMLKYVGHLSVFWTERRSDIDYIYGKNVRESDGESLWINNKGEENRFEVSSANSFKSSVELVSTDDGTGIGVFWADERRERKDIFASKIARADGTLLGKFLSNGPYNFQVIPSRDGLSALASWSFDINKIPDYMQVIDYLITRDGDGERKEFIISGNNRPLTDNTIKQGGSYEYIIKRARLLDVRVDKDPLETPPSNSVAYRAPIATPRLRVSPIVLADNVVELRCESADGSDLVGRKVKFYRGSDSNTNLMEIIEVVNVERNDLEEGEIRSFIAISDLPIYELTWYSAKIKYLDIESQFAMPVSVVSSLTPDDNEEQGFTGESGRGSRGSKINCYLATSSSKGYSNSIVHNLVRFRESSLKEYLCGRVAVSAYEVLSQRSAMMLKSNAYRIRNAFQIMVPVTRSSVAPFVVILLMYIFIRLRHKQRV